MRILFSIATLFFLACAADAEIVVHDDAANAPYLDGWDNGDNGGFGMGAWNLSFDGDAGALNSAYGGDPHFIDGVGVGPLLNNQLGNPAFGLTTDNSTSNSAMATRSFNTPITIGDTFRMSLDGSALEGAPRIGNIFQLVGEDDIARYTLSTSLGSNGDKWSSNGNNTEIAAGDAFDLTFTLNSVDSYSLSLRHLTNMTGFITFNGSLAGTAGMDITSLRIGTSGTGSSADGAREFFFQGISVTSAVPEPSSALFGGGMLLAAMLRRRRIG